MSFRKSPMGQDPCFTEDPMYQIPVERSYFFDGGIRFECLCCGACCTGSPGVVYVNDSEIIAIAGYLGVSEADFRRRCLYSFRDRYSIQEHSDGRCLFYEAGCRIYPVRPLQCRTYPFWVENMRSRYHWRRVRRECPGIGVGRLYDRPEILAILQRQMD